MRIHHSVILHAMRASIYIYIFHTRTLCNTFNFNIIIQLFASVALHGAMEIDVDGDDGRFHNDDDELDPIDRAPFRLAS